MKIKKVDDKPMVIHTKKKAKLHTHEQKKASIKAFKSAGSFNDIVTSYMVKYGVGDTATVMNDTSKSSVNWTYEKTRWNTDTG